MFSPLLGRDIRLSEVKKLDISRTEYQLVRRINDSNFSECNIIINKGKESRYRPGVAQRVGTGIALLFHDRGTRRG